MSLYNSAIVYRYVPPITIAKFREYKFCELNIENTLSGWF